MATTPNYGFPAPEQADSPDVPRDILALAAAVDTALKAEATSRIGGDNSLSAAITAVKGTGWVAGKTIMDLYTKVPSARIWYRTATVDPNSSGDATLTHGAGFVPSHWMVTVYSSSGANPHVSVTVDTRVNTANQLGLNLWDVKNNRAWTSPIGIAYVLRD